MFDKEFSGKNRLPVEEIRYRFHQALHRGPVIVEAPTGSGKSTKIPLWCTQKGRVLVIEPRRIACLSLASYVQSLLSGGQSAKVGYAVRFESKYSQQSMVVFATPGVALGWYAADKFAEYDVVVLDEFHERRWDTDLLASMLAGDGKTLVLTSATLEGDRLSGFFGGTRLQSTGKLYDVEVRYSGKDVLPRAKGLDKRAADAVLQVLGQTRGGDVLVFLPGKAEISAVKARLEKKSLEAEIIPLHASVDVQSQDRALSLSETSRIILATNVAETSLTLPGVRAVIDSGLVRRTHYRNGRTVLALSAISQSTAEQRRGRAGRLGPGICIRLWGNAARLEPYTPPEVVREDPIEFVLAAAACGHRAEDLSCPDPPPEHALSKAISRLYHLGALDRAGLITDKGRGLFRMPLDSQLAHLITAMQENETRNDMVDLAAALSVQGDIMQHQQSFRGWEKLREFAPENCDACTLIRLVRTDAPKEVRLNQGLLSEARKIAEQIRSTLEVNRPEKDLAPFRDNFVQQVLRAEPELAFVRRVKRYWTLGNGCEEIEPGYNSRMPSSSPAALVFDRHSIPGRGTTKTLTYATCLAPVSFQDLAEAGLGEVRWSRPKIEESKITVRAERVYAGRVIDSWDQESEGEELCAAVAELIAGEDLWPEVGRQLKEDIQAWNLYVRLGFAHDQEVEVLSWLRSTLKDIGLQTSEDFKVLEADDIKFPGIPPQDRPQFDRAYPRHLSLPNLELEVRYDLSRKRITLIRAAGIRKSAPQRWELPQWERYWKIFFQDGSRVVPVD